MVEDAPMRIAPMRSIGVFLLLVGGSLAADGAFIVLYKFQFEYRLLIIPLHVILMAALATGLTLILGLLVSIRRYRSSRLGRAVTALVPVTACTLVVSLYVSDWVSTTMWGHNITLRLAVTFLPQLRSTIAVMPFSPLWVYLPFAMLVSAIFGASLAVSRTLLMALEELFLPGRRFSLFGTRGRAIASSVVLVVAAGAFGCLMTKTLNSPRNFWHGEPLVGLFKRAPIFGDDSLRAALAAEDKRVHASYPRNLPFDRRNVIVIMVDSLRADHMEVCGYPRPTTPYLAGLRREGWLRTPRYTASTCSESMCGVVSTLASRKQSGLSFYNFKLNDLLRDQGYRVYFALAGDHTTWYGYQELLGRNMDLRFDGSDSQRYSIDDDGLLLEALEQVPDSTGNPAFFFFFMMSAHFVGVKYEAYDTFKPSTLGGLPMWSADRAALVNRYDNGVLQTDALIAQVFEALSRKGYLQNAIAVILADHGEALGEHGHFSHGEYLYQEDIGIPILIYDDPAVHYPDIGLATQVDVAPTILARLGLPLPSSWQGVSLLDGEAKPYSFHTTWYRSAPKYKPVHVVFSQTNDALYKYIVREGDGGQPETEELFDLRADPGEAYNLLPEADAQLVAGLKGAAAQEFGSSSACCAPAEAAGE